VVEPATLARPSPPVSLRNRPLELVTTYPTYTAQLSIGRSFHGWSRLRRALEPRGARLVQSMPLNIGVFSRLLLGVIPLL